MTLCTYQPVLACRKTPNNLRLENTNMTMCSLSMIFWTAQMSQPANVIGRSKSNENKSSVELNQCQQHYLLSATLVFRSCLPLSSETRIAVTLSYLTLTCQLFVMMTNHELTSNHSSLKHHPYSSKSRLTVLRRSSVKTCGFLANRWDKSMDHLLSKWHPPLHRWVLGLWLKTVLYSRHSCWHLGSRMESKTASDHLASTLVVRAKHIVSSMLSKKTCFTWSHRWTEHLRKSCATYRHAWTRSSAYLINETKTNSKSRTR